MRNDICFWCHSKAVGRIRWPKLKDSKFNSRFNNGYFYICYTHLIIDVFEGGYSKGTYELDNDAKLAESIYLLHKE